MRHSTLEITDQEYLIKLPKDDFELRFIYQLLNRIQCEKLCFNKPEAETETDVKSRNLSYDPDTRFDQLSDK